MKSYIFTCLLAISSLVYAVEEPIWKNTSSDNINWISLLPSGNILAVGDAKVFCLNASDGSLLWENESYKELEKDNLSILPYTNYIVINKETTIIIDANTGKEIVSSVEVGLNTVNYYSVVYDKNSLFLAGIKEEKTTIVLVDLTSGQKSWETVVESFDSEEIKYVNVLEGNSMLIADETNFLNINLETGNINWTYTAQDKDFEYVYLHPEENAAFLVGGTIYGLTGSCSIEAVDVKSGESLFPKINLKGGFHWLKFSNGEVLIAWGQGFNKINIETGEFELAPRVIYSEKTTLFHRTDKGYMFVKLYGQRYTLNYFDYEGNPIIKGIKSGYFREMGLEGDNVFILTTSMFGLYDGTTGKKIKEKSVMVVPNFSMVLFDKNTNSYMAFGDKKLYKLNKNNYTVNVFSSEIKQYNSASMSKMEIRESGYLVRAENELSLIGFDGKEIYHNSYQTLMSAKDFMIAPPKISFNIAGAKIAETNYSAGIDKAISDRYNRDGETADNVIIQTKFKEDDVKSIGILSVDKDTGEELKKIKIMERDPIYIIDEIDNILYYKTGTNEIRSYQL